MAGQENLSHKVMDLRQKAEEKIRNQANPMTEDPGDFSSETMGRIFHELRVHHVELEMQNEELRSTQEELSVSRQLYFDLYDLAPVGYCIVSEKGLILKTNVTTATLLGRTRDALANQPITRFIAREDQDIFYHHRQLLFETRRPLAVELKLVPADRPPFWARLETALARHEDGTSVCRVVLSDISEPKKTECALKERVKELNFFYELSDLLERPGISLEELLRETVALIPGAWRFSEITQACIELEGRLIHTHSFRETRWMQTSDIILGRQKVGRVTVCYLTAPPPDGGGPFLIQENRLIKAIAERLGHIIARVRMVEAVRRSEAQLTAKAAELEEMNTALKVLLKRRDRDKSEIQEKIFANYQLILTPIIQNLKQTLTRKQQEDAVDILEKELKNILSPFSKKLSDRMIRLTPREIHIANLIRLGKSNKEMSEILNCSSHTISRHRDNIRKKTGLTNQKINLRSFLLSLE
jgi:PAS domain S-box-containing protein